MTNVEGVTFNLTHPAGTGGLIVYADHERLRGQSFEVWINKGVTNGVEYAAVKRHIINGREVWAAVFPSLPAGTHTLHPWTGVFYNFTIRAGLITQIDEAQYRDESIGLWYKYR